MGYDDPDLSTEDRIADLLERMTREEKIGQLFCEAIAGSPAEIIADLGEMIREDYLGMASPIGRPGAPNDAAEALEIANELQRIATEETRLGIPLLFSTNAVHGHAYVDSGTVFPHSLGLAATRDLSLVEDVNAITAREMAATGIHLNYGPVVDICRDPRWGRTFETFGESTYLCGELGAAAARGHHEADVPVRPTIKHFPAYGEPQGGEDAAVNELSETTFRRMHLAAFERALAVDDVDVMPCYNSIDGEPVHGSKRFVDDLLREEGAFDGMVISDHHGTQMIVDEHGTAPSLRDAIRQSLEAGIDAFLDSNTPETYQSHLESLIADGDLAEERIDEAVSRVLRIKFDLGLFEDPAVDPSVLSHDIGTTEAKELERDAARRSLVLLKNNDVLPLSGDESILLTGPAADEVNPLIGGWSRDGGGITVREGLEETGAAVTYEAGCGIRTAGDLDAAVDAATDADVAIVVLGDGSYIHEFGAIKEDVETGEYPTRTELRPPAVQRELLQGIYETGTPTVGIVVGGRPPVIPWAAENIPAILVGFYPGAAGGDAIADVLFGADPGGVLPISIPRSTGHLPQRFNHYPHPHPIGDEEHPATYDPLYPFGHGESYTTFEVSDLSLTPDTVGPTDTVTVGVTVENVGDRDGIKPIDVFVSDRVSSKVTPVRELRGFDVAALEAGKSTAVEIEVDVSSLGIYRGNGDYLVEPGEFEVHVEGMSETFEVVD